MIGERAHQHVAARPQAHPQPAECAVSDDPGRGDDLAARIAHREVVIVLPLFFSSATSTPAGAEERLAPRWNSDANASRRAGGGDADWCGVETSTRSQSGRTGQRRACGYQELPAYSARSLCLCSHLASTGALGRAPCQTTGVAARTAYEKIWDDHALGSDLLYVDLHLVHEVTSPQAFEGLRLAGRTRAPARSHDCDGRPQRAHVGSLAPHRGRHRAAAARRPGAQRRGVRHPVLRARPPPAGHRARDRARARHHAAGHDDRLRRLAHLDARRVRGARLRHRHERGRARAGHADAPAEARAHAARHVHGRARRAASARRT